MNRFLLLVLLSLPGIAFAAFSAFVVITPQNEAEHPFRVQVEPLDEQRAASRVRVVGPVDGSQKVWLIVCKRPLAVYRQNFRSFIWDGEPQGGDILRATRLKRAASRSVEAGGQEYPYVEVDLPHAVMRRAYVYIDYPQAVKDGGRYYSIDLGFYLEDGSSRKSWIRWEASQE